MKIDLEKINQDYGMSATYGEHEILLDNSISGGGQGEGFSPMALQLISLAGCSAIDVTHILKKKRKEIRSYTTEVHGERREEYPRYFSKITMLIKIDTDASDKALEQAAELTRTKYCSVFAILDATAEIDMKIERI